jgi:hypothetical protein
MSTFIFSVNTQSNLGEQIQANPIPVISGRGNPINPLTGTR